jgi:hypothetical protein
MKLLSFVGKQFAFAFSRLSHRRRMRTKCVKTSLILQRSYEAPREKQTYCSTQRDSKEEGEEKTAENVGERVREAVVEGK